MARVFWFVFYFVERRMMLLYLQLYTVMRVIVSDLFTVKYFNLTAQGTLQALNFTIAVF